MVLYPIMSFLMPADKKFNGDQSIFSRKIPFESVVIFFLQSLCHLKATLSWKKGSTKIIGKQ